MTEKESSGAVQEQSEQEEKKFSGFEPLEEPENVKEQM